MLPLQLPPINFTELKDLVELYNLIEETDPIQRIFYLQKINNVLNRTSLDADLFAWLYHPEAEGWKQHLIAHAINPDASIFLKGIQFAKAVAEQIKSPIEPSSIKNEYELMQERDLLLQNKMYRECQEQYMDLSVRFAKLAKEDKRISELVARQTEILARAKAKLNAIKGQDSELPVHSPAVKYSTKELTSDQANNFNFKFTMTGWEQPFVFRVEDRLDLGLEQSLHSFPLSKYFVEDFAVFMWGFKDKESNIEYKPVVLSQFANQGNLAELAKNLKSKRQDRIAPIIDHYFVQLADFCAQLLVAKTYHPDIKLSNFLVHNNRIVISDRKTLVTTERCFVHQMRSTPLFAPDEYNNCVTAYGGFTLESLKTKISLPQFMAYQLGMALKQFLILTQLDDLPDEFREHDVSAASYFSAPGRAILNLSALVQELTREDAEKRMSIKQMQQLLKFRNLPPANFYCEIEKVLPASTLGIQEEVDAINNLIQSTLNEKDLLKQASLIFDKITNMSPREPRLTHWAEKLAEKCFTKASYRYFSSFSNKIEKALLDKDWDEAPWYRKLVHVLTFGYYRVERVTQASAVSISHDLQGEEFQEHINVLQYANKSLLLKLGLSQADNIKEFIMSHLDEILPEDEELVKDAHADSSYSKIMEYAEDDLTLGIDDDTTTETATNTLDNEEPAQTVQIKKSLASQKKSDKSTTSLESQDQTTEEATKPTKRKFGFNRFGFGTFRTTMFKGDSVLHPKKADRHPSLTDAFDEPQEKSLTVNY